MGIVREVRLSQLRVIVVIENFRADQINLVDALNVGSRRRLNRRDLIGNLFTWLAELAGLGRFGNSIEVV